jgi:general secretion pathway protein M
MTLPAPGRPERWLAPGLLCAVLALVYMLFVHPDWVVPMREAGRRIEALQARELRIRAQLAQAPQVERRLQETEDALADRAGFLPEDSPELASAGLARRLDEAVSAASPDGTGCAIDNRSPLPPQPATGRFVRIAVHANLRCGVPELATVLHTLEGGVPRLFVDTLEVSARPLQDDRAADGGLDASFDLVGYLDPLLVASLEPVDAH